MNFFLTTVLVAIVFYTHTDAYILLGSKESAMNPLERKCNKNAHTDNAYTDLTDAFEYLPKCFEKVMGIPPPNVLTDYNLFCERIGSSDYYTCIDNFVKTASPCLDEDEVYLPNLILTAYNVSLEDCCGKNGLNNVNDLIQDISSSTCVVNNLSLEAMLYRCSNNLITFKNIENEDFTLKKDDLCSDIRSLKGCAIQSLKDLCNEDHTVTISLVIDPFLAEC